MFRLVSRCSILVLEVVETLFTSTSIMRMDFASYRFNHKRWLAVLVRIALMQVSQGTVKP